MLALIAYPLSGKPVADPGAVPQTWGEAKANPVRAKVATLDNDASRWAVAAVKDGEVSELSETAEIPTAVIPASWGQIKTGK